MNQYFQEDSLWGLLYSLATPLDYLQSKNIIYGVIDTSRIFLDKNISLLDPSSTAIDPYLISENRLYSPELLNQQRQIQNIDMFKSDVYILGLLMLQSALLRIQVSEINYDFVQKGLQQLQAIYSQQFRQILSRMLSFDPQKRPSFKQILKSLSDMFQISTSQIENLEPLKPDSQNYSNAIFYFQQCIQQQKEDILKDQCKYQEKSVIQQLTQYQKARVKFLQLNDFYEQNNYQQHSQSIDLSSVDNSYCMQNIIMNQCSNNRKISRSKQIKQKLIRNQQFYNHSDKNQINSKIKRFHKRSHTNLLNNIEINQGKVQICYQNNPNLINKKNVRQIYLNNLQNIKIDRKNKQNKGKFFNIRQQNKNFNKSQQIKIYDKENLFTKPEIMNMIKVDMQRIQQKRKNIKNKIN